MNNVSPASVSASNGQASKKPLCAKRAKSFCFTLPKTTHCITQTVERKGLDSPALTVLDSNSQENGTTSTPVSRRTLLIKGMGKGETVQSGMIVEKSVANQASCCGLTQRRQRGWGRSLTAVCHQSSAASGVGSPLVALLMP